MYTFVERNKIVMNANENKNFIFGDLLWKTIERRLCTKMRTKIESN